MKTDARDALKLARLHAAGQLTLVRVPSVEQEQVRDLVRAREDIREDLIRGRDRLGKLLLRREIVGSIYPMSQVAMSRFSSRLACCASPQPSTLPASPRSFSEVPSKHRRFWRGESVVVGPVETVVPTRMADDKSGLLEAPRRTLRKPFPSYRLRNGPLAALARAVSYRRRTIDQIDEKVIEHVQEYGFVTNRTLQRLFDRDLDAARDLLIDLRDRGLLEKLGTARGGRGVKYGPGAPVSAGQTSS